VRQFSRSFRSCFTRPQRRYFEIVLAALLLCEGAKTLTNLLRQLVVTASLPGLSRFLGHAPWAPAAVASAWRQRFAAQVAPLVAADLARQRALQPRRRGRQPTPVVTGYLIGDDSTCAKPHAAKQAGLGRHHSTSEQRRVQGHSLVQGLYVLAGRQCPLAPQLYRQQAVCDREGVPFQSKIDLVEALIRAHEPVAETQTHVLLDSWYAAKRIWQAARERGFLITTGLRNNRWLRVDDPQAPKGWRWQRLTDYVATLGPADYQRRRWPHGAGDSQEVWVHVVQTRVRKLFRCQVVVVRLTLDGPVKDVRFWASSDVAAEAATLLAHIATRWQIEQLFADTKELLGLDQYQVMRAEAIVRWWTLVLAAYTYLDEERYRLGSAQQQHVTLGAARRAVQQRCWVQGLVWLREQAHDGRSFMTAVCQMAA
jgi:hypothetical protein